MSWAEATIANLVGDIGLFCDGDWVESEDQDPNGDVRLIQLADVGDGYYRDKSNRFLTSTKAKELRCTFLKPGDILIARMPDPLGRACIFPGDEKRSVTVVDVCIVRSPEEQFNHRWLMHFVNSPKFRGQVAALQSGSTRKRISRKNLSTIVLPVPPKALQSDIAAKIDELFSDLDAGIASLKRTREKLKRYRASVLKAAVEGRLTENWRAEQKAKGVAVEPAAKLLERILAERRKKWEIAQLKKFADAGKHPPKDWQDKYSESSTPEPENLSELPQGWCWATTDQLFWYVTSGSRGWAQYYSDGGAVFIRIGNLDHYTIEIDLRDIQYVSPPVGAEGARTRVEKDDILISITADVGMIGRVVDNLEKAYINQHIALGRCSDAALASFTAWFLASSVG